MELEIVYLSPDELTPYEGNARRHAPDDIEQIKESIAADGFNDPIGIWGEDNIIVEGHGRQIAAKEMGLKLVPCIRLDHLTDTQRRDYAIRHNRTAELSGWDFAKLEEEIAALEIEGVDLSGLKFEFDKNYDWFQREEKDGAAREEGNDEYNDFLDKFEPKKTTDDCYTPEIVYDAIAEWVTQEYGINRLHFVRPFYPGGDYKNYSYPKDCAVVDNPPFSILAEIISWYVEKNIRFFLFAPQLTLFSSSSSSSSCCLPCGVAITYENGAVVPTSFVTNLEDNRVRVIPELYKVVEAANDKNLEATRRTLPKYKYPDYVLTAAMCNYMCAHDTPLTIKREDSQRVRYLDSQKEYGDKAIFGSGFLLSEKAAAEKAAAEKAAAEKAAAEKAAAEKAAAEKAAAHVWELSDREWQIIKSLGHE